MELYELTLTQARQALRGRTISPVELVRSLLARIDAVEPAIQAWERVDADGALRAARAAEAILRRGDGDPLCGVPVGVKDVFHVAGLPTRAGFAPFDDLVPAADAAAVAGLRRAGAIVLGKTVTVQFAYGGDPPRTRNPWRLDRTPGGSSSGSAAAVAAGMVPGALGSQAGGSLLRPAAYCGLVALKPTFGRISRVGELAGNASFGHPGPIGRSVEDVAHLLAAMAGHDPRDPDSLEQLPGDYVAAAGPAALAPRLGLLGDLLERAEPDVRAHLQATLRRLERAGARIDEARLPAELDLLMAIHFVILAVEEAAVHAELHRRYAEEYRPGIRAAIEVGHLIPGVAIAHAQALRRRLRPAVDALADRFDALVAPTARDVAPDPATIGDHSLQSVPSLFGLPSLTLPSGSSADGLPYGLQLIASRRDEERLLRAAGWCEQALGRLGLAPWPPAGIAV